MNEHKLIIREPAKGTPCRALPDGAIAGNGDLTVVLGGSADRVRLHIGKADFWKADGRVAVPHRGGLAPLCVAELLLPHLAYADYEAVEDLTNANIRLSLSAGELSASLTVTVCAGENTILLELDRSYPTVSASLALLPIEGSDAATGSGAEGDVSYTVRSFDSPEYRFPSAGIAALRRISRTVADGRERILWAIAVATNHDSAAYRHTAVERVRSLDGGACRRLLSEHAAHWAEFWSKSEVSLPDKEIELYFYAGLYAVACCTGNKRFPPGLWGAFATEDGMGWFGDYHLNYNYEAPFYALCACNHPELLAPYAAPLRDFLPTAEHYAREYLGVGGAYFPVAIGPLGLETDLRPETKEHGHLFLGQKSNGAYAAVVPMLHWYTTRDLAFARREYYGFLLSVADFWRDWLVSRDGGLHDLCDALHEVKWWSGADHMPSGQDDRDPILSICLVRMLMRLLIDISSELGENTERIREWEEILTKLPEPETFRKDGRELLRCKAGAEYLDDLVTESVYPIGAIGEKLTPRLWKAASETHRALSIWDSENRFCSYYPAAARLGYSAEEILSHIRETIKKRALPNGMFRAVGGGLENSAAIPATVCEMLLQSYEGVLRLFPVWDRSRDASFRGLRAFGAFLVDAELRGGKLTASILCEKGGRLCLESPVGGYTVIRGGDHRITVTDPTVTLDTVPGERITVITE